jgi:hypothetical protein
LDLRSLFRELSEKNIKPTNFNLINRSIYRFQRSYIQAKTETLKWEKILSNTKDYIADNERQTLTLVDSIHQLYSIFAKRNQEKAPLKRFEIADQLDYIRDEIEILEDIIKRAHVKMGKEGKSLLVFQGTNRFENNEIGSNLSPGSSLK